MDSRNLNYLLQIEEPAIFVERCYQDLLGRSIAPSDLRDLLSLLDQGMNHAALIYCIIKSPEFHNRFSVENISFFKKQYVRYKLFNLFYRVFGNLGKMARSASLSVPDQYPDIAAPIPYDEAYITYQATSLCNIVQLEERLQNVSADSTVITSPVKLYNLLNTTSADSFIKEIPGSLIFSMPSLPLLEGQSAIIWDRDWDSLQSDVGCSKIFRSPRSSGRIVFYHNSSSYRKVFLHFQVSSLERKSELFMKCNNTIRRIPLSLRQTTVEIPIYLNPFYNELSFVYVGTGKQLSSGETSQLKFFMENIAVFPDSGRQNRHNGGNAIAHFTADSVGDGYFPYLLSDSYIRSQLHKNGFFEVSAVKLLKSYQIIPLDTTRYDYLSDSFNGQGYYCYIQRDKAPAQSGVILYTATRTGTLSTD